MNRRAFLQAAAALPVLLRGGGKANAQSPISAGGGDLGRTVALVHGSDAEKMVRKAFDILGGARRFVRTGSLVAVKPNVSFANAPDWGNNTNPEVLAAVCKVCREAGARKVLVLDYPLARGAEALRQNGAEQAVKDLRGVSLRVLGAETDFRPVRVSGAKALPEIQVAREALDADLLINLPVAKAHDAVAASLGIKNLMGLIWDRSVFHSQVEIHAALCDLARVVRPGLTLIDMTRIMVTNGPKGPGEVVTPEALVASVDPVAVDAFALTQSRFNGRKLAPRQLRYLTLCHEAGLGQIDLGQCRIVKESA